MLGSLLSIKPVIKVKDGNVAEESKQRTRSRAMEYLADKMAVRAPSNGWRWATAPAPTSTTSSTTWTGWRCDDRG